MTWRKRIVFSLIPLLGLLVAAEGVARIFPHREEQKTAAGFAEPDADLLWRLRPTADGPYATNEMGFRDRPWVPDADVNVLLLGDSVAWGDGIPVERVFSEVLEGALNRANASKVHQVINAGVPGYSTFQQSTFLRLHGPKLEPDLVVLQFCLNDVVERYHTLAEYGGDNIFLGVDTRVARGGVRRFLLAHSRAFEALHRFLQRVSRKREEYDVRKMARDELGPELEGAWERTLAELDEIAATAESRGIPLVLLVAPYRFQLDDPAGLGQPQLQLHAWARSREIAIVDLLPAFSKANTTHPMFIDANHFSAYGHLLAGDQLFPVVRRALP